MSVVLLWLLVHPVALEQPEMDLPSAEDRPAGEPLPGNQSAAPAVKPNADCGTAVGAWPSGVSGGPYPYPLARRFC
jgi:hypothetical protein